MAITVVKTAETIITDDDGYRYRIFLDETGLQMVYEEFDSTQSSYVQRDRIGIPFTKTIDAIINALLEVETVMKKVGME